LARYYDHFSDFRLLLLTLHQAKDQMILALVCLQANR
jgi:hypothetical protein